MRELLSIPSHGQPEALRELKKATDILEVVLLSTCNRFEIYFHAREVSATRSVLLGILSPRPGLRIPESHLYAFADSSAARHLFHVASGLDSMVVGEHEILGQVKRAYQTAHASGTTGKLMNILFQRALYIGKRVRTETGLSRGAGSVASLAVTMAERILGTLDKSRVMILGAGEMAELTAKHLLEHRVRSLIVSNRTHGRACALAERFGGAALRFDEGLRQMVNADIIVCSTAAPHPIVRPSQVREMMAQRGGRSLVFIDIAVPRDVHPEVRGIENVYVYDIDDLQAIFNQGLTKRKKETRAAEEIVEEEMQEFDRWLRAFQAGCGYSFRHCKAMSSARESEDRPLLSQSRSLALMEEVI